MILTDEFLQPYKTKHIDFGFGDLSEFVFLDKYSRLKDGRKEQWWEAVHRNVEGIFRLIEEYGTRKDSPLSSKLKKTLAEYMFDDMFNFRFLPAGRPFANIGTPIIDRKKWAMALYNCAWFNFAEASDIAEGFRFIMDGSLKGTGIGIGVDPMRDIKINNDPTWKMKRFRIPDTVEGWGEAIEMLVRSFIRPDRTNIIFDYSLIREKGSPIRDIPNAHPGHEPLKNMLEDVEELLKTNSVLDARLIADISNLIGACVVSGGQRRTALLLLGSEKDEDYMDLKDRNLEKNEYRQKWMYTSNNSVWVDKKSDLEPIKERVATGNDLGLVFLDNLQQYGRMADGLLEVFENITGVNPCGEIGLEHMELCNLVEINPNRLTSERIARQTLASATLYAKAISMMPTVWEETNKVINRNRRIGIGLTGLVQFKSKVGEEQFIRKLDTWYGFIERIEDTVSHLLDIPRSIKRTTVKPSGHMSLLMGTTAGIHHAPADYYIRRCRVVRGSDYEQYFKAKGYRVELDTYDFNGNTSVIDFIVSNNNVDTIDDVSAVEQLRLAMLVQRYWSDNAVSITVTFEDEELDEMFDFISRHRDAFKSLSFLRKEKHGYVQAPQEKITQDRFVDELEQIKERKVEVDHDFHFPDASVEKFCNSDVCEIELEVDTERFK